tara:strand:+ start:290 stop:496 length:207 start_codon:yes stop_codon:yes gene_type:complete
VFCSLLVRDICEDGGDTDSLGWRAIAQRERIPFFSRFPAVNNATEMERMIYFNIETAYCEAVLAMVWA